MATPHIGYVSHNVYTTFYRHIAEDLAAYLDGHPVRIITPS